MQDTVRIVAVIMVGLLAGLMIGTGLEQHSLRALDASAWVQEHQVMDSWFRVILPPWWNASVLLLAAAAFVSHGRDRWLFSASALLMLTSLLITVKVEVPMNRLIATWNAAAPPATWAAIRDRWLMFHRLRTTSGVGAFLLAILALARSSSVR